MTTKTGAEPIEAIGQVTAANVHRDYGGREDAFKGQRTYEDVYVSEWGKWYRVRGLTGIERDQYESSITITERDGSERINVKNARPKLLVVSVVDANDQLLFSMSDVPQLAKQPAAAIQKVFDVARRISGLSTEVSREIDQAFASAQNDDSTSD